MLPFTVHITFIHTVKERADYHSTCLIYKCQNNLAPQYVVDHFNNISESHNYNTRSSTHGDIKLANLNNNQLMRTFKNNGAKLFRHLYTITHLLKSRLCWSDSQLKLLYMGFLLVLDDS